MEYKIRVAMDECSDNGNAKMDGDLLVSKLLDLFNVVDLLIAWEQYKKANWWESESIDVEKVLMKQFSETYER
jgi:hypothetical protein